MAAVEETFASLLGIAKEWVFPVGAFAFLVLYPLVFVWPIVTRPRAEPEVADCKEDATKAVKAKPRRRLVGIFAALIAAVLAAAVPQVRHSLDGMYRVFSLVTKVALYMDLDTFEIEHRAMYAKAVEDGNYSPVTIHYYSVQASILQIGVGHYWHFMPEDPKLSLADNFGVLNQNFADRLALKPNQTLCELGCGLCRTGRDVASRMGARFIGVTMSPAEVELGTAELKSLGLQDVAEIRQGDYTETALPEGQCDGVLAVFTLKYSEGGPGGKLNRAFAEISRILPPQGKFVSYEILTTDTYDPANETHAGWTYNISYHTGMPPLNSVRHFREDTAAHGLQLKEEFDMETREGVMRTGHSFPFKMYTPVQNVLKGFMWFIDSIGIKKGLGKYSDNFVEHPTEDLRDSMLANVVTSSTIFTYERPA